MRSEQDLARTLRTAAEHAGGSSASLADAVAARRRARRLRQRLRVALAAAAVVIVTGGTAAVLSQGDGRAAPAVTVTDPTPVAEPTGPATPARIEHAEKSWPQAVLKVPARSERGGKLQPVTALSPTEVLLVADVAFEKAGRLEVHDATRGTTRVLGAVPTPDGVKRYYPQRFEVGERHIAWYGRTPQDGDDWADFWVMPRAGGRARQVAEVTGEAAHVDEIRLVGDTLVWSVERGGVYRVPLTGGTPQRLPDSDRLRLATWPWAMDHPGNWRTTNPTRAVNLETGASVPISVPAGAKYVECDGQWCAGAADDRVFVQRLDGAGRRSLPVEFRPGALGAMFLGDGRLLLRMYPPQGAPPHAAEPGTPSDVVYDPVGGGMVGVGRVRSGSDVYIGHVATGASSSSPSTTPFWDADLVHERKCVEGEGCRSEPRGGGKEWTVLNLLAVTR